MRAPSAMLLAALVFAGPDPSPSPAAPPPCSEDGWCFETLPLPAGGHPTAVHAAHDGSVWIGGSGGALLRRDRSGEWKDLSGSVGSEPIDSIYVAKNEVWIAAKALWRSADGTTFSEVRLPAPALDRDPENDLEAPPEAVLVAGDGGRPFVLVVRVGQFLFVPTADSWKAVPIERGARVNAIDVASPADAWIGGEERILFHWDGKKLREGTLAGAEGDDWRSRRATEGDEPDDAVWSEGVSSLDHGIAAMNRGVRKRTSSGEWRPWKNVPPECAMPVAVEGASEKDLWLASRRGVCHYDGKKFRTEKLPEHAFIERFASGPAGQWAIDGREAFVLRKLPAAAPAP